MPAGTSRVIPPSCVIPETATLYVDGPPLTLTPGVAAPNAVPETLRSCARTPMFDGGSYVTGAALSSLPKETLKSTGVVDVPIAVAGAVTVGVGADGGAPSSGVAQILLTSTVRLPPPDPDSGYSKVTATCVTSVKFPFGGSKL